MKCSKCGGDTYQYKTGEISCLSCGFTTNNINISDPFNISDSTPHNISGFINKLKVKNNLKLKDYIIAYLVFNILILFSFFINIATFYFIGTILFEGLNFPIFFTTFLFLLFVASFFVLTYFSFRFTVQEMLLKEVIK